MSSLLKLPKPQIAKELSPLTSRQNQTQPLNVCAGVAQGQSSCFVNSGSEVRFLSPAFVFDLNEKSKRAATALMEVDPTNRRIDIP